MNLTDKLSTLNKPDLPILKSGKNDKISDFWNDFIVPLLPDKNVVVEMYQLLLKYINDKDAVFAIRCFGSWPNKLHDNKELRRGFYNKTDSDYSFFYTDNFYAAYFCKMAIDGYVPDYDEFKHAMISRKFPARFGRSTKEERDRAAYSIDGSKGKDPLFTRNGYKIAHVFNAGKDYEINGENLTINNICSKYFPRGNYNDWNIEHDSYGQFYVRNLSISDPVALEILKAHFLRFVCPLNYVLTPGGKHHNTITKVPQNDIAECPELQQYAVEQFNKIYGDVYRDFLSRIMISTLPTINNPGDYYIGITYGYNIGSNKQNANLLSSVSQVSKQSKQITNSNKTVNSLSMQSLKVLKSGEYARKIFTALLKSGELSSGMLLNLRNKKYCSDNISISYPVIVELGVDTFDPKRYYKTLVLGKYLICSQWYERHIERINTWLLNIINVSKVGKFAFSIFADLLNTHKLSINQIINLKNQKYCSQNLGISFSVLVENGVDIFDPKRYYKTVILGKYLICSQWYNRNILSIIVWYLLNMF